MSLQFSEIVVFGIVWGGLMIFFLTPFKRKANIEFKKTTKVTFPNALKDSLIKIALHKKAILALIMLMITLNYTWSYHSQLEWYNNAHGGGEMSINPTKQAIYYMVSITIYAILLYLFLAFRRTLTLLKSY